MFLSSHPCVAVSSSVPVAVTVAAVTAAVVAAIAVSAAAVAVVVVGTACTAGADWLELAPWRLLLFLPNGRRSLRSL